MRPFEALGVEGLVSHRAVVKVFYYLRVCVLGFFQRGCCAGSYRLVPLG